MQTPNIRSPDISPLKVTPPRISQERGTFNSLSISTLSSITRENIEKLEQLIPEIAATIEKEEGTLEWIFQTLMTKWAVIFGFEETSNANVFEKLNKEFGNPVQTLNMFSTSVQYFKGEFRNLFKGETDLSITNFELFLGALVLSILLTRTKNFVDVMHGNQMVFNFALFSENTPSLVTSFYNWFKTYLGKNKSTLWAWQQKIYIPISVFVMIETFDMGDSLLLECRFYQPWRQWEIFCDKCLQRVREYLGSGAGLTLMATNKMFSERILVDCILKDIRWDVLPNLQLPSSAFTLMREKVNEWCLLHDPCERNYRYLVWHLMLNCLVSPFFIPASGERPQIFETQESLWCFFLARTSWMMKKWLLGKKEEVVGEKRARVSSSSNNLI